MELKTPAEILEYTSDKGVEKTERKVSDMLILAFLAGVFIAFAAASTNMAAFNLLEDESTYGLGRLMKGVLFGTGLLLVVATGAELFTGNTMIIVSVLDKRVTVRKMLFNWCVVYLGNMAGSLFIAYLMYLSGLFNTSSGSYGGVTIQIAASKASLAFGPAVILGFMCNWLVCLAVWISYGSKALINKAAAVFPIIGVFVIVGFEHSIANMYYIPAGILAKQNPAWLAASQSAEKAANLNWGAFFVNNLLPVTLGNIIGGMVMVGIVNWVVFGKKRAGKQPSGH